MESEDVIRAWKSEAFRASLPNPQDVPAHPAGPIELGSLELSTVHAAATLICTIGPVCSVVFSCYFSCRPLTCDILFCAV